MSGTLYYVDRLRGLSRTFRDGTQMREELEAAADRLEELERAVDDDYAALREFLAAVVERASRGKGKERHACGRPFHEQPIFTLGRLSGPGGHAFQVMKKVQEALRMEPKAAQRELLDVAVYAAAWWKILEEEGET